ncbi:MAG: hypothetical protein KDK33_13030 [Leptospiraceae bacterium]|nr:hypothetical protein [Leptospiraceae bacterium]
MKNQKNMHRIDRGRWTVQKMDEGRLDVRLEFLSEESLNRLLGDLQQILPSLYRSRKRSGPGSKTHKQPELSMGDGSISRMDIPPLRGNRSNRQAS